MDLIGEQTLISGYSQVPNKQSFISNFHFETEFTKSFIIKTQFQKNSSENSLIN